MVPSDPIVDAWCELHARTPQRVVVDSPTEPDHRCTVAELERCARRLGEQLPDPVRGSEPLDPIAISVPNGPLFLAAFLATRRAGRAAVLLDSASPRADRTAAALRMGASALLAAPHGWGGADSVDITRLAPDPALPPLPSGTAAVKLTSGSTGEVQGIAVSSENLLADDRQLASTMAVTPDDRILAAVPLSHSYGFASIALPCLLRGNLLVVPPAGRPLGALTASRRGEVTFLPTVPAFIDALLRSERPPPLPRTLRLLITAGAPLRATTARSFQELYGRPVQPFYGASECGGIAFDRDGSAGLDGALGPAVDGVTITLHAQAASDDTEREGTVEVASPAVALGYHPTPSTTLAAGRFRTSDRGRLESGSLRLLGRVDQVLNVRGMKVHPSEVEQVLSTVPGVDDVVVLGVPGPHGSVLAAVVAVSVPAPSEAQLRRFCLDRLPPHKVPRRLVRTDSLPRTVRGKLDHPAVLRLLDASTPLRDSAEESA